ncbi:MAG: FMN-binding glutamate synthase family protein [Thermonemataceae bacterium]
MKEFFQNMSSLFEEVIQLEMISLHYLWLLIPLVLLYMFISDVANKQQTIKHNFPVVGRLRYLLESIGPELRQYIVANNREELPFNRSERSWIYASSKKENNLEGFGTDKNIFGSGHIFINPNLFPYQLSPTHPNRMNPYFLPCAKVMGAYNKRKRPFRPYSVVNISAMSYGSLSKNAVKALNMGSMAVGTYHNTGEGGLSPYHAYGGDVMFHFGTGYFGVRDEAGNFSMEKLIQLVDQKPFIRAIEVKLSQGAKPGKGGILPGKTVDAEIAAIRGIKKGESALSPASHTAFTSVREMLEFIEDSAEKTGLPVGFKAAVGKLTMWEEVAEWMLSTGKGPDFITIDGGEGGTGAAPHSFADHVSMPFVFAFSDVYKIFAERGLTNRVVFIASGRLGLPAKALMAFAMGADCIQVAREAMLSIGCIQAKKCHDNTCPVGITTQNKWLMSGLNPENKAGRYANYIKTLLKEMLDITNDCGFEHPAQFTIRVVEMGTGDANSILTLEESFGYQKVEVPFTNTQALLDCSYLGGLAKATSTTT